MIDLIQESRDITDDIVTELHGQELARDIAIKLAMNKMFEEITNANQRADQPRQSAEAKAGMVNSGLSTNRKPNVRRAKTPAKKSPTD